MIDAPANSRVPSSTNWYVLASSSYPFGPITFYPAKSDGLTETFPHQGLNAFGPVSQPFRAGHLCVTQNYTAVRTRPDETEPFHADGRLRWHAERAKRWLVAAASDALQAVGEPLQLPAFPIATWSPSVAVSEGPDSFTNWLDCPDRAGRVACWLMPVAVAPLLGQRFFVDLFCQVDGRPIHRPKWGRLFERLKCEVHVGFWVRLDGPPIRPPWSFPATWGELRAAFKREGCNLDQLIRLLQNEKADGSPVLLLLGFPVPEMVGDDASRMHWQSLQLTAASALNAVGVLAPAAVPSETTLIDWIPTVNWHPDQLGSRGQLPSTVAARRFLIIGAGALGSAVAEILARAGVHRMRILDGDLIAAGNLVRHTATLLDLGLPKATVVARRLDSVSPHADVSAHTDWFPPADVTLANGFDIVLDTTGDDEVIARLGAFSWDSEKLFVSVSLGLGARRLFCFASQGPHFPADVFRELLAPLLAQDRAESAGEPMPLEELGCWNPVFPARIDDVWLLAATAVKEIEHVILNPPRDSRLITFRQRFEAGRFCGIDRESDRSASQMPR